MKKKINVGFVTAVLAVLFMPVIAFAEEAPTEVMEVIVIDGREASEPYPPMFDRFTAVYKKYDSAAQRSLWFNSLAGPQTGVLVLTILYPSIAAFANDAEVVPSPEYQALAQEFQQKGFRVVSRSLSYRSR